MDLANGGIAVVPVSGIMVKPAIAPTVPRMANRLMRMPRMAAATTELDGPEGSMGQLYIISTALKIGSQSRSNGK
jgi:hypothetical protein